MYHVTSVVESFEEVLDVLVEQEEFSIEQERITVQAQQV